MGELLPEIIQILERDSALTILTAISAIATLATALTAFFVMLYTVIRNRKLDIEERKNRLLIVQGNYPLLIFRSDNKVETLTHGKLVPDHISCGIETVENKPFYRISIDNGIIKKSSKPFCSLFFSLINKSHAIIKNVKLVNVYVQTPTKLENKSLDWKYQSFSCTLNSEMSNTLLLKEQGIKCCIQLFLDLEDYLPFFSDDINVALHFSMKTISGLTFYQSIVYNGNDTDIDYYYSENIKDVPPLPLHGKITIS